MRGKEGYYYPNTIKKMVVAAIGLFSDIVVYKYDKRGNIVKQIKVPVIFGSQLSAHRSRTNEEQKEFVPTFPRIEVHLVGFIADDERKVSPLTKRFWDVQNLKVKKEDNVGDVLVELNEVFTDFNPLPYNYQFQVSVFSESVDYMSQITENIFPYYDMANSTMRIKEFDFLNIERDINVVLGSPDIAIGTESLAATDRRTADLKFTLELQGWMYRKVRSTKLIKTIDVLYGVDNFEAEDNTSNISMANDNGEFIGIVGDVLVKNNVTTLEILPYDELRYLYDKTPNPVAVFPPFIEPLIPSRQEAAERAVMIEAINFNMETTYDKKDGTRTTTGVTP